jgi:hypothetical protein
MCVCVYIYIYEDRERRYKIIMTVNYMRHETYMDKERHPLRAYTVLMFGIETRPSAARPTSRGSIPDSYNNFPLLHNVQFGTGTHAASYRVGPGK